MTITRADVADLRAGDVVELTSPDVPTVRATAPAVDISPGRLYVGLFLVRWETGEVPAGVRGFDLTVISRAKPPLYVNSDKTEPDPGDVVRSDLEGSAWTWGYQTDRHWHDTAIGEPVLGGLHGFPLHLLVDGRTGQVVQ